MDFALLDVMVRKAAIERGTTPDPIVCRLIRRRAGLTQAQLANAIGVSRPVLARWETGARTPKGANRSRYLLALTHLSNFDRSDRPGDSVTTDKSTPASVLTEGPTGQSDAPRDCGPAGTGPRVVNDSADRGDGADATG